MHDKSLVQQRIDSLKAYGGLRRIYNYTFTGLNTEVISFDIKLGVYFWQPLASGYDTSAAHGINTNETPSQQSETRSNILQGNADKSIVDGSAGNSSISHASDVSASGPQHVRFLGSVAQADPDGKIKNSTSPTAEQYNLEFESRISNDLISLEGMKVLGDPIWLTSRESLGGALNKPQVSEAIRLNIFSPSQNDYMRPNKSSMSSDRSIGGFYEIYEVNHMFSGGVFTQEFTGYRLKNLGIAD
jgi:hypothetical protein